MVFLVVHIIIVHCFKQTFKKVISWNNSVNSVFHLSRIGNLSNGLHGLVKAEHVHLCQVADNTVAHHMAGDTL